MDRIMVEEKEEQKLQKIRKKDVPGKGRIFYQKISDKIVKYLGRLSEEEIESINKGEQLDKEAFERAVSIQKEINKYGVE